jgi:spore coat protein CotH
MRGYPPAAPLYHLYADPDDLAWLAQDPYRDETIPATFCSSSISGASGGKCWEVNVRYRGDVSRLMPKKNWKAFFPGSDLFPAQGTLPQEELNLNADYPDQTLLRSAICYDLFTRVGVPASRAGYARLNINGAYYGLFSEVEQVDERFLHRQGIEIHGNLYKPFYGGLHALDYIENPNEKLWWYRYYYPKRTNREGGIGDVVAFVELISHTPDAQFPQAIAEVLDVNEWLDWYAVNILIGNFEMMEKNYYMYHDLDAGRWIFMPWDLDLTLGHNTGPGGGGYGHLLDTELSWDNPIDSGTQESKKVDGKWNGLIDRMMNVPEFRFFHCRRLKDLMADEFSPAEMFPRIDETFSYIHSAGLADPNRWQPTGFQFSDGPAELKTYVTNRIQFLEGEMPTFCPNLEVPLTINEFLAANSSTVADEFGDYDDWIEIYNAGSILTWDLGGMYLTDDLSEPTKWRIPDDTLIPPGDTLLFWADGEESEGSRHASFTLGGAGGQIGLFDRDVFGNAAISTLTYGAQTTDVSYGRLPDGSETWQSFSQPTPGWRNEGRPPFISGTARAPVHPTSGTSVAVTSVITDEGAVTATLWYRAFPAGEEPPAYQFVSMSAAGGNQYTGNIPSRPDGTWVEYYVEAEDAAGMVSVDRPEWPEGDYRYIVGWQPPPLYINELMAINTHTVEDEHSDHDDWIELHNAGTEAIDLGGMCFSNNVGLTAQYTMPAGIIVPAGGYVVLWADGDGAGSHLDFKLSGAGEYVGLFDSQARYYAPIDAVYYDPQTPDVSWGRFPDAGDEWHVMDAPTPGESNRLLPPQFSQVSRTPTWPGAGESVTVTAVVTAGGSIVSVTLWYDAGSGFQAVPMMGGSVYTAHVPAQSSGTLADYYLEAVDSAGQRTLSPAAAPAVTHRYLVGYAPWPVLINEFLADNATVNQDEAGEYDDWVELYNPNAAPVTLSGMYLTDDLSQPTKWPFPAGTVIGPGGHLLVWCDGETEQGSLHASFRLNRDGEEIGLLADDAHSNVPLDVFVFGPQQEDISYGRKPDGADTWGAFDPPTPGASNG